MNRLSAEVQAHAALNHQVFVELLLSDSECQFAAGGGKLFAHDIIVHECCYGCIITQGLHCAQEFRAECKFVFVYTVWRHLVVLYPLLTGMAAY